MLAPDVLEILDDPEVGGGVPFQVRRVTNKRSLGSVTREPVIYDVTGNIQPENKSSQSSTAEDLLSESIVVYAAFVFQTGSNPGEPVVTTVNDEAVSVASFVGPDEILYNGHVWRVTQVQNWEEWGFSVAHATKVMG